MPLHHDIPKDKFPDPIFEMWKNEGDELMSRPTSFARIILERLGQLNHWTENPSLLDEASSSIRELDAFQKVLSSYLISVQETVDALRGAVRPFSFGKGIDTLPDEILSMIFESFGTGLYGFVTRDCSLVLRRFRRVVLNTPRIWCNVSTRMNSMSSVIRHLERSKSVGLNVQIIPKPTDPFCRAPYLDQLEVLDAVISHKERWESIELGISTASIPHNMRERLDKLTHLPRLEDLCFDRADGLLEDPRFLKSVCAPQLRRLRAINCLPGPSALSSTITSLELTIVEFLVDLQLCHRLHALLGSVQNLTKASLILNCYEIALPSSIEFTPLILRNLKILEFDVYSVACDELLSFRKALITPALVNCVFSVRASEVACFVEEDGSLSANYLDFMLCHDEYPTLEALSVYFDAMNDRIASFTIPFEKVPNLHELTIDTCGFYPIFESERISALRSLTLRNLGTWEWSRFRYVWNLLRRRGDLPGLQKVVIGNRVVNQESAEEFFDGGGYGLR